MWLAQDDWSGAPAELSGGSRRELVGPQVRPSLAAVAVAVFSPLGALCGRSRRLGPAVVAGLSTVRVVPSLAILLRFPYRREVGRPPPLAERSFLLAPVAPALPAGPPNRINTDTGLGGPDRATVEAARAMGRTAPRSFAKVRSPVAADVLPAGVRIAAASTDSLVSVTPRLDAGGFGRPLIDGLAGDHPSMILPGTLAVVAVVAVPPAAYLLSRGLERLTPAARARGAGRARRRPTVGSAAVR